MQISNVKIDYHRNGICGNGFFVATFKMKEGKEKHHMVAVLFSDIGNCAVFDIDELKKNNIDFANGNSWRGDHFEDELRKYIW